MLQWPRSSSTSFPPGPHIYRNFLQPDTQARYHYLCSCSFAAQSCSIKTNKGTDNGHIAACSLQDCVGIRQFGNQCCTNFPFVPFIGLSVYHSCCMAIINGMFVLQHLHARSRQTSILHLPALGQYRFYLLPLQPIHCGVLLSASFVAMWHWLSAACGSMLQLWCAAGCARGSGLKGRAMLPWAASCLTPLQMWRPPPPRYQTAASPVTSWNAQKRQVTCTHTLKPDVCITGFKCNAEVTPTHQRGSVLSHSSQAFKCNAEATQTHQQGSGLLRSKENLLACLQGSHICSLRHN